MLTRRQFAFAAALQARRRPNVLFVLCEGWRRQTMPGQDRALRAPAMARLMAEGVEFTRAYATNPATGPSQAALHTGRYPHAVSVPWSGRALPAEYPAFAESFAAAGYRTGFSGRWPLGDGPRRGFTDWGTGALEFIEKNAGAPFLLFVSLPVQQPAEPFASMYPREGLALRENVPPKIAMEARKTMATYLGACSAVDAALGKLVQAAGEDTIVVVTSDRGAMVRSHGLDGDRAWYEESAGVPLLMRWPGKLQAGTKQDWLVNNVDVGPTLRGLCGLDPAEGAQGEDRSELILKGGDGVRPESIYGQGELGTGREWRMIVRGWDKLVVDRGLKAAHLYNLAQDPFEMDDLIIDRASVRRQEELLALMRRWMIKTADRVPYPGKSPE